MTNEEVLIALQYLVDTPYDDSVKAVITELTGRSRVVGPHDISTKELDPNRINVQIAPTEAGCIDLKLITGFSFG